ncbi:MAG: HlyD family efflux transporter periplasmic adaptor subunit [Planctomycetes bacterium]|nr:HlyD family efflux transporter periplasmic adaptor subunit [Planctomycetota bacterium]
MRTRTSLLLAVPVLLTVILVGCKRGSPETPKGETDPAAANGTSSRLLMPDDPKADIGNALFKAAGPPPTYPTSALGNEPIVIPNMTVQFEDRQTVSAEVDGKIELIATPMTKRPDGVWEYHLADGTVVTHDPAKFDMKSLHPRIEFNPRDKLVYKDNPEKWTPYYKLREGELVSDDQILCLLDDALVSTKLKSAKQIKEAASQGIKAAQEGVKLTEEKMKLYKDVASSISAKERLEDQITLTRFTENLAQSSSTIAKAEQEHDEAVVMLHRHRIKSRVDGIIRTVAKRPGEFVRAGEKIYEIQSTEKVRLEGNLDVQYYDRVKRNSLVTVEPALPSAPMKSHAWHRQEASGVAVTGHPTQPLIVSASLDGSALVWDPNLKGEPNRASTPSNLPHPVPVRSVACTPPGSKAILAVTGGDDGKIRVWDVSDLNKLQKSPVSPISEPTDAHASGIQAVAISPDGKYAATAAGREVFIWDLAAGKKLYALPDSHRDSITSLSFTPQAQLVTASKDRTLKVWRVGSEKAAVARTIDHRSGAIDVLGVSPDGGRVLFDQDKTRVDLVNLSDSQTIGQLTNVGPSVAFATLAVFGPDYVAPNSPVEKMPYTIVTAGGEGDLKGGLQVWHAPRAGGRGSEVARFITPGRVGVTCAAFSPHKDIPFLVVGTAAGTVHVWTPPAGPATRLEGRITNIDATDPRYMTVRVEMSNKNVGLLDRSAATVIVNPGQ